MSQAKKYRVQLLRGLLLVAVGALFVPGGRRTRRHRGAGSGRHLRRQQPGALLPSRTPRAHAALRTRRRRGRPPARGTRPLPVRFEHQCLARFRGADGLGRRAGQLPRPYRGGCRGRRRAALVARAGAGTRRRRGLAIGVAGALPLFRGAVLRQPGRRDPPVAPPRARRRVGAQGARHTGRHPRRRHLVARRAARGADDRETDHRGDSRAALLDVVRQRGQDALLRDGLARRSERRHARDRPREVPRGALRDRDPGPGADPRRCGRSDDGGGSCGSRRSAFPVDHGRADDLRQ